jgi:hypothetical protein
MGPIFTVQSTHPLQYIQAISLPTLQYTHSISLPFDAFDSLHHTPACALPPPTALTVSISF